MIISLAGALSLAALSEPSGPVAAWPVESAQLRVVQRSDGPGRFHCTTDAEGEAQGAIAANLCRLGGQMSARTGNGGATFIVEIGSGDAPLPGARITGAMLLADAEAEVIVDAAGRLRTCRPRGPADTEICAWLGAQASSPVPAGAPLRRGRVRIASFAADAAMAQR
jgi:hypothetical protein